MSIYYLPFSTKNLTAFWVKLLPLFFQFSFFFSFLLFFLSIASFFIFDFIDKKKKFNNHSGYLWTSKVNQIILRQLQYSLILNLSQVKSRVEIFFFINFILFFLKFIPIFFLLVSWLFFDRLSRLGLIETTLTQFNFKPKLGKELGYEIFFYQFHFLI